MMKVRHRRVLDLFCGSEPSETVCKEPRCFVARRSELAGVWEKGKLPGIFMDMVEVKAGNRWK